MRDRTPSKSSSVAVPISIPLRTSLKQTLSNRNFLLFIGTETLYFVALSMIASGMLYILTVLLGLPEALGGEGGEEALSIGEVMGGRGVGHRSLAARLHRRLDQHLGSGGRRA